MIYRGKIDLQERLAAEYVLGTLRGRARHRFQSWMRDDATLRLVVGQWEERLAPMAAAIPEVTPPARLWTDIQARIAPPAGAAGSITPAGSTAARASWWDSLAFWRSWGLVTTGLAAVLVATTVLRPPQIIEREIVKTVEVPSKQAQPSFVAMLEDGKGNMVFMAQVNRDSDELWVKRVGMQPITPAQSYELWGLPGKPGMPVKSLGVVPRGEIGVIKLAAVADRMLADFPRLAISLEPAGGSTTGQPTGPVMYQGDRYQFW